MIAADQYRLIDLGPLVRITDYLYPTTPRNTHSERFGRHFLMVTVNFKVRKSRNRNKINCSCNALASDYKVLNYKG